MREIVSFLSRHSLIYEKLNEINIKELGIKKKVKVFKGVDLKKYYHLIIITNQKARFLQKDIEVFEDIVTKIVQKDGHNYKKKLLIIENEICSLAKEKLKDNGWRVIRGIV